MLFAKAYVILQKVDK